MPPTKPNAKRQLITRLGVVLAVSAVIFAGCSQSEDGISDSSEPEARTSLTGLGFTAPTSTTTRNITTSTSLPVLGTTTTQVPVQEKSSSSSPAVTTTTTSLAPAETGSTLSEATVAEATSSEGTDTENALPAEILSGIVYFSGNGSPMSVSLNPVHSRNFASPPSWFGDRIDNLDSLTNPPGDYLLELLDGSDNVLRSISFDAGEIEVDCAEPCPETAEPNNALFGLTITDPPDYLKLRFSRQGSVFDTITRSASTPSIYDLVLSMPGAQPEGEDILLTWSATDDDNDDLQYIVSYSVDSGRSYLVLSMNTDATSINISPDLLGGSDTARIAVSASDGLRSALVESEIFSVQNKPPDASIDASDGIIIFGPQSLVLTASGYDLEDGNLPSAAFSWRSSIDGDLGVGRYIVVSGADLTAGEHEITMTATDSAGNQVADRIYITVRK